MRRPQRGQGAIVTFIVVILALVGLFALCNDDDGDDDVDLDGIGRVTLINHEYEGDRCYRYGDCRGDSGNDGEYRDDNRRGGISPGPFDRSPVDFRDNRVVVCFPFSRCDAQDDDDQPQEGPI